MKKSTKLYLLALLFLVIMMHSEQEGSWLFAILDLPLIIILLLLLSPFLFYARKYRQFQRLQSPNLEEEQKLISSLKSKRKIFLIALPVFLIGNISYSLVFINDPSVLGPTVAITYLCSLGGVFVVNFILFQIPFADHKNSITKFQVLPLSYTFLLSTIPSLQFSIILSKMEVLASITFQEVHLSNFHIIPILFMCVAAFLFASSQNSNHQKLIPIPLPILAEKLLATGSLLTIFIQIMVLKNLDDPNTFFHIQYFSFMPILSSILLILIFNFINLASIQSAVTSFKFLPAEGRKRRWVVLGLVVVSMWAVFAKAYSEYRQHPFDGFIFQTRQCNPEGDESITVEATVYTPPPKYEKSLQNQLAALELYKTTRNQFEQLIEALDWPPPQF